MDLLDGPIEPYFHGVLRVSREDGRVRLHRLTPSQVACHEQNPSRGIRARCPAGATLVLLTNSRWLDLEFEVLSGCRRYFGIDVETDGALTHAVRVAEAPDRWRGRLFEWLEAKPREITVYLPHTQDLRLLRVGLEPDATIEPVARRPLKLLCLGDSITQGMDACSPFALYPTQLGRLLNAEVLNQGIGGHHFDIDTLEVPPGFVPDLITVAYGTNDWSKGYTADEFRPVVRAYLEKLTSLFATARIAVLSPIWREVGLQERCGLTLPALSQIILEEAVRARGVFPIDGLELVPHLPEYYADGTHPNETGFLYYALNLYRLLRYRI